MKENFTTNKRMTYAERIEALESVLNFCQHRHPKLNTQFITDRINEVKHEQQKDKQANRIYSKYKKAIGRHDYSKGLFEMFEEAGIS